MLLLQLMSSYIVSVYTVRRNAGNKDYIQVGRE